jgi:hypothetical protein
MWNISTTPALLPAEKLASLSIESPENLHTKGDFGLLAALWCGRMRDLVRMGNASLPFSFGFYSGEVVIQPNGGRIRNQGRLKVEASRRKISLLETSQFRKDGTVGGRLMLKLTKWLGWFHAEVGGQLKKTSSRTAQQSGEYDQIVWRVADAGHNCWRVFGTGLNDEGILEYKIIGDDPICFILADEDQVHVEASFRCDLRDLWFKREGQSFIVKDKRFSQDEDERNRIAVAKRVIAIALIERTSSVNMSLGEGMVTISKQELRAGKASKSESDR